MNVKATNFGFVSCFPYKKYSLSAENLPVGASILEIFSPSVGLMHFWRIRFECRALICYLRTAASVTERYQISDSWHIPIIIWVLDCPVNMENTRKHSLLHLRRSPLYSI